MAGQDAETFIYHVSHDARAMVRALRELPQWVIEDVEEAGIDLPAGVVANLELIRSRMERLDRLLLDLRDYSRVGRRPGPVGDDAQAVVDRTVAALDVPGHVAIRVDAAQGALPIGSDDVVRVLSHLADNAIRHGGDDLSEIVLKVAPDEMHRLAISVEDDGQGIPEADRDRVLEPLVTLQPRDAGGGSGIGLAVVAKIARLHGGTVRLSAPEPGGCRVVVTLCPTRS